MTKTEQFSPHTKSLWHFDEAARERGAREYVKSYYHHLDAGLAKHSHDFYEINIVTGGTGRHVIEEKEILAQKGDVFVVPPHVRHGYTCNERITVYHILLSNRFMAAFAPLLEKTEGFQMLFDIEPMLRSRLEKAYFLKFDTTGFELLKPYLALLESENEPQIIFHTLSLIALLCRRLSRLRALPPSDLSTDRTLSLIESMEYVAAHPGERIDYVQMAARCAMSYSTYLRLFKRFSGVTPTEYQMNCRIRTAADLLQSTNDSVLSIALSCGFFDSSHFIREFTKRRGVTPSEFRRMG